jgi:hypothetical protein
MAALEQRVRPGRTVSATTASGMRGFRAGTEDAALLLMRERALARSPLLRGLGRAYLFGMRRRMGRLRRT